MVGRCAVHARVAWKTSANIAFVDTYFRVTFDCLGSNHVFGARDARYHTGLNNSARTGTRKDSVNLTRDADLRHVCALQVGKKCGALVFAFEIFCRNALHPQLSLPHF
jgi:hypothetical protein